MWILHVQVLEAGSEVKVRPKSQIEKKLGPPDILDLKISEAATIAPTHTNCAILPKCRDTSQVEEAEEAVVVEAAEAEVAVEEVEAIGSSKSDSLSTRSRSTTRSSSDSTTHSASYPMATSARPFGLLCDESCPTHSASLDRKATLCPSARTLSSDTSH